MVVRYDGTPRPAPVSHSGPFPASSSSDYPSHGNEQPERIDPTPFFPLFFLPFSLPEARREHSKAGDGDEDAKVVQVRHLPPFF